jgi:hypothetical protein
MRFFPAALFLVLFSMLSASAGAQSGQNHSALLKRPLQPFVDEIAPGGGIDITKSLWQKPGRGTGKLPDLRYMRAAVETLYRMGKRTGTPEYHLLANAQVSYIVRTVKEDDPAWLHGTALECIGLYHRYNRPDPALQQAAFRIVGWLRKHRVTIDTGEVTFGHFPCGYGIKKLNAKDAGWTNDLSIVGSGLVFAYEVTKDKGILLDAVNFSEFFLQPWRKGALGEDGYWHAGTWRKDLGSWVVGPLHYSGFESTNAYGDETSWIFSTFSVTNYLTHLYQYKQDSRIIDTCRKSMSWVFDNCQFRDGGVGICGRDDKWLGAAGYAVSQYADLCAAHPKQSLELTKHARVSYDYLCRQLSQRELNPHGIEWVNHKTLPDPLVNVGWMWLNALLGVLNGDQTF